MAFIETDKALEFTFASSQFTLDMFAMANAVQMKQGDVATLESRLYEVAAGLKITLPYEVQEKSVRINGFEEAAEAAAGKFSVVITSTGEGAPNTVITFAENDVAAGDMVLCLLYHLIPLFMDCQVVPVIFSSSTAKSPYTFSALLSESKRALFQRASPKEKAYSPFEFWLPAWARFSCAGPEIRLPLPSKREPWQGQSQLRSSGFHSN